MWRQLIAVLSFILLLHRPALASTTYTRFAKRQADNPGNYHCGAKKIFDHEFLLAAAEAATQELSSQVLTDHAYSNSKYPSIYRGPLRFGQKKTLWLWPLSENRQANSEPVKPGEYFLILAENVPLRIVGVIVRGNEEYVKCDPEKNAENRLPQASKFGYECPSSKFPRMAIDIAMQAVYRHKKNKKPGIGGISLPWPFSGGKTLFGYNGPLFAWPIRPDGRFHGFAPTSVILNKYNKVIGMVETNRGKIYQCKSYKDVNKSIPQNYRGHSRK
ncbi:hypothetical protein K3495_g1233 [Podosphaera aphanis]|nr:hypothetical protein K3495_g1233 [Podosphaera aphanis]